MINEVEKRTVTLDDVARLAGVAKSTASAALNGKEGKYAVAESKRQSVLKAARELNFEANPNAKNLSAGRDHDTVGIFTHDIDAGVGMQKIRQIQLLLSNAGYNAPIYSSGAPELGDSEVQARLIASMRLQRPRAIVMAMTATLAPAIETELQKYQSKGGIVVTYDHASAFPCDQVVFDGEGDTYNATKYLLELGHRKIGFYLDGAGVIEKNRRFVGFRRAMREYGIEPRSEWLVNSGNYETGLLQEGGGVFLAQRFLEWRERPTAMCIVNDASAIAFMASIGRAGLRVPQDVSIVGHDDLPLSSIYPTTLTTVTYPVRESAAGVLELLLPRLKGQYDGPPRRIDIHGELRIRESTIPVSENL